MAATWRAAALEQAELVSDRLRRLASSGLHFLHNEFGLDLGVSPELWPSWVILTAVLVGLLVAVWWVVACGGATRRKRRTGARETHVNVSGAVSATDGGKTQPAKTARTEEPKKKNKKKASEKQKTQPNGRTVTEPREEIKAVQESPKQATPPPQKQSQKQQQQQPPQKQQQQQQQQQPPQKQQQQQQPLQKQQQQQPPQKQQQKPQQQPPQKQQQQQQPLQKQQQQQQQPLQKQQQQQPSQKQQQPPQKLQQQQPQQKQQQQQQQQPPQKQQQQPPQKQQQQQQQPPQKQQQQQPPQKQPPQQKQQQQQQPPPPADDKAKKNKKKPKPEGKQGQNASDGKEPDEGAWETKVSNREKRQQRKKEKGPGEPGSPVAGEHGGKHTAQPVMAPVITKNKKESLNLKAEKKEAVITPAPANWNTMSSVNSGEWKEMLKITPQVKTSDNEKWSVNMKKSGQRNSEPLTRGQESDGTWTAMDGRIKPERNTVNFAMLGLNPSAGDPAADLGKLVNHALVDNEWSGINGLGGGDSGSDWNAPAVAWGNYEEPKVETPAVRETPVSKPPVNAPQLQDSDDDEKEKGDPSGSGKSKRKKKKKKKPEDENASSQVNSEVLAASAESSTNKPRPHVPQEEPAKQNVIPPASQKKNDQNWEPPKQVQKKKARRET